MEYFKYAQPPETWTQIKNKSWFKHFFDSTLGYKI